ncbi:MAG: nicotinamidase [Rubricoccaceae bacterium]
MSAPSLREGDALLLIDVQNDFLPGGALAVPEGDAVVPVLNRWIAAAKAAGAPVFATRDWHPPDHTSFEAQGGPWPSHCVRDTEGAAFPADLALPEGAVVVSKATLPRAEAYSGFEGTDLAERLRAAGVRRVFVGGLATDYCVRASVLDARREGFEVRLIPGGHRGIAEDTTETALAEMARAGALVAAEAQ